MLQALFKPGPDIVVLDEAHSMLKSNNTNIFKTLNQQTARLRLALTGTPLQNNLSEYFNMASWVRPGCLGTEAQFSQKYERPIMAGSAYPLFAGTSTYIHIFIRVSHKYFLSFSP